MQAPSCSLCSWQAGGRSRQAGQVGWAVPSNPFLRNGAHSCTCTHTPDTSMHNLPPSCLWTKAVSTFPAASQTQQGRNPYGSLRLNQGNPLSSWPPTWAAGTGCLAKSHNTHLLAPLPASRIPGVGGKKTQFPVGAQASEERGEVDRGVFGFRSQGPELPRHWVGEVHRELGDTWRKEEPSGLAPPRALSLQPGVPQQCPPPSEWLGALGPSVPRTHSQRG